MIAVRPAFAFRRLRSRLSVFYVGLFAVAMLTISGALALVVQHYAEAQVRRELSASGIVFDRLWEQQTAQLRDSAGLLARDFGFRAAVATHDADTIDSALANLKARLGLRMAFIVNVDGTVTGIDDAGLARQAATLAGELDDNVTAGVVTLGGQPRHIVAAPILTPALSGWVVFSGDLGQAEMRGLEKLSAIPLSAAVYQRGGDGRWHAADAGDGVRDRIAGRFIDRRLARGLPAAFDGPTGKSIALAKILPTIPGAPQAVLLLQYPIAQALAAYRPLQLAIALFQLLTFGLVLFATLRIARSITQPIALLDKAARRLANGETTTVTVSGRDEIARLATTFNRMVGEIAERERRITHLAFNDVLTGLSNRALFHEHLDHQLRLAERRQGAIALLCLDLDHFKAINDTLGHPIGDELLKLVAQRLVETVDDAFVARLGGDEFVVVLWLDEGAAGIEQIEALSRRLLDVLAAPCRIAGHDIATSASIGIALSSTDGAAAETLLRNADLALYRAKEAGRAGYCFYEPSLNARAQARRAIEIDLRGAIDRSEFRLYFQPLFDLASDRINAFEALIRWEHPTRGLVMPLDFIPIAEETGLIVPIGAWVMREACRQAITWPDDIKVAVNVSSVQFRRPGLAETVMEALQSSGIRPGRLEVEITESIFLDSTDTTLTLLHALRGLGVRVALDDFGTGYSSLSYLQSFPFDKIKIDRSFIIGLLTRQGAGAIVKAITDLAAALGMETTAEGVEDHGQLAALRLHGCSSVQGYLFSRPITAPDVRAMLARDDDFGAVAA